ncbi:TCB2 protein, partial [Atractosteus spatula]|nr:TCB2 protein [Atractosteus spatula]
NITRPTVKILRPSKKEIKDKGRATLVCVITGFYPDHITVSWKVSGQDRTNGVKTGDTAIKDKEGKYSITSRLRVSALEWFTPKKNFTCVTTFFNESAPVEISIKGKEGRCR